MARFDDLDEFDEPEPGTEADQDDDLPVMSCPNCGGAVVEDTQKCPHCGDWITPADAASGGWKRWLFAVAVLLMLLAMARFVLW